MIWQLLQQPLYFAVLSLLGFEHICIPPAEDELQASSPTNLHLGEQNSSIFHAEGGEEYVYVRIYS